MPAASSPPPRMGCTVPSNSVNPFKRSLIVYESQYLHLSGIPHGSPQGPDPGDRPPDGLHPHFFNLDQFEEAKDCLQHCEVLYAHSADLLRAAPATLKWYCFALCRGGPLLQGPWPVRQPGLPADQLQRLRRYHRRACGDGDPDAAAADAGVHRNRPRPRLVQSVARPLHPGQRIHHPGHRGYRTPCGGPVAGHGGREDRGSQPQRKAPPRLRRGVSHLRSGRRARPAQKSW